MILLLTNFKITQNYKFLNEKMVDGNTSTCVRDVYSIQDVPGGMCQTSGGCSLC